jgi:EF hand
MKAQLILIASALLLVSNIAGAHDLQAPSAGAQEQEPPSAKRTGEDMMGRMGQNMMGHGMMRPGMMRHRMHMRVMMILMDADGDGALSLEEVQTAHAKIFKAIDADKDGKVTFEEMEMFFRGGSPTMGR